MQPEYTFEQQFLEEPEYNQRYPGVWGNQDARTPYDSDQGHGGQVRTRETTEPVQQLSQQQNAVAQQVTQSLSVAVRFIHPFVLSRSN